MYKICTYNKIAKKGLNEFSSNYEIIPEFEKPDGIVLRSFNLLEKSFNDNLLAIARAGAGVNNIPVDRCTDEGIVVFNTPGANANAVAELVIAGLLMASRNIHAAFNWIDTLDSNPETKKEIEAGKGQFAGNEIYGKKIGIIGLGAIGKKVATYCNVLGMKVFCYDPFADKNSYPDLNIVTSLNEAIEEADFVSIHVPFSDKTKGLIGKKELEKMSSNTVLLNFSRDALCDEIEVLKALENNKLNKYVTDFPNDKTLKKDGVIAIPHLGASSAEAEENCGIMAAQELIDYIENGNIKNSVNFPNINLGKKEGNRLSIIGRDMSKNEINKLLEDNKLEAKSLEFGERNNSFYALIESEKDLNSNMIESIGNIDKVIKVRVI